MADRVSRLLESTLDELESYRHLQLFADAELRSIVQQRTKFEYKLQRRVAIKADYLRYIQFELNLDALRKKRRARVKVHDSAQSHLRRIDSAAVARVSVLFDRALRKFGDDVSLWLSYVGFLQSRHCTKLLSRLFPRAHGLHPHSADLWVAAASHEMNDNGDVNAMRVTMQRAIRLNPSNTLLYVKFFELELQFIAKVMERRRVLGINSREEEREGDIDLRFSDRSNNGEADNGSDQSPLFASDPAILTALLPRAIVKNAIERKPSKDNKFLLERRKRRKLEKTKSASDAESDVGAAIVLELCEQFLARIPDPCNPHFVAPEVSGRLDDSSPAVLLASFYQHNCHTYKTRVDFTPLITEILAALESRCSSEPRAWLLLAQHANIDASEESEKAACAVFDRALKSAVASAALHQTFLDYLMQRVDAHTDNSSLHSWLTLQWRNAAKTVVSEADAEDEKLVELAVDALLETDAHHDAVQQCERLLQCDASRASNWLSLVRAAMASGADVGALVERACSKVDRRESQPFWVLHIEILILSAGTFDDKRVHETFQRAALSCANRAPIECLYLDWLLRMATAGTISLPQLREYHRIARPMTVDAVRLAIQAELALRTNITTITRADSDAAIRGHFEALVDASSLAWQSFEAWIRWERAINDHARANQILWRAHKSLHEADHRALEHALTL